MKKLTRREFLKIPAVVMLGSALVKVPAVNPAQSEFTQSDRLNRIIHHYNLDDSLENLGLALSQQSMMRFDAMGIRIDGFREKCEQYFHCGFRRDESFILAFLDHAEELIEEAHSIWA